MPEITESSKMKAHKMIMISLSDITPEQLHRRISLLDNCWPFSLSCKFLAEIVCNTKYIRNFIQDKHSYCASLFHLFSYLEFRFVNL